MLIDLELQASGSVYTSETCILGAGIAGLLLAQRLAALGVNVHLLEMSAHMHSGTTEGRFRAFGGSSIRWGGQLLPYTDDIFAPPVGCASPPWPIRPEEIEPYYAEILSIMGTNNLPFTADLVTALGHPAVEFTDSVRLRFSKWAPFDRRNLAPGIGKLCLEHPKITVFTHANAITFESGRSGGKINSVAVKNYSGGTFKFAADKFIVAMGTIESTRLLLNSDVGNCHDQVGRFFHDHLGMHAALIDGRARVELLRRLGPFFVSGTLHTCKLEASTALRTREHLAAAMAHIVVVEPEDSGIGAVRNLLGSLQRGELKQAIMKNLLPMVRGAADVTRLLWYSRVRKRRAVSRKATIYLNVDVEQIPDPDNRIRLSDTVDALGQRKAIVDWRVSPEDAVTATRYAQCIKKELETVGIEPLNWLPNVLLPTAAPALADTFHPMGGLRMGTDSRHSVVDPDLKVHGVDNLYVSSCATFPSGGSSNPTFTLMALTLRLADRLTAKDSLRRSPLQAPSGAVRSPVE
jgi:choline dehydrogenase-like flavoprotein